MMEFLHLEVCNRIDLMIRLSGLVCTVLCEVFCGTH